jgi:hypothetical protein
MEIPDEPESPGTVSISTSPGPYLPKPFKSLSNITLHHRWESKTREDCKGALQRLSKGILHTDCGKPRVWGWILR